MSRASNNLMEQANFELIFVFTHKLEIREYLHDSNDGFVVFRLELSVEQVLENICLPEDGRMTEICSN
jgi:hypothetical protein